MYRILFMTLCIQSTYCSTPIQGPIVNTSIGKIRGTEKKVDRNKIFLFRGIRYAQAPVDSLRFRKPEKVSPWNDTFDATHYGPSCMQHRYPSIDFPHGEISEDCLFLNIFVPRTLNPNSSRSVMVWIHGGVFLNGQASRFDGSLISLRGDVIIVTINYRLSIFGFLSTNDSFSPGNYGLWDQNMALLWVKTNIADFGGNPRSITLFGQSAGATSVYLHSFCQHSSVLFQRGIVQSGFGFINKQPPDISRRMAFNIARDLSCTNSSDYFSANTQYVVECLRGKSTDEIQHSTSVYINAHDRVITNNTLTPVFGVVLDGDFLSEWPTTMTQNLSADDMIRSIDIMAGFNNDEGGLIYYHLVVLQYFYGYNIDYGVPNDVLCQIYAPSIANQFYNDDVNISNAICNEYTANDGDQIAQAQYTVNVIRDHLYTSRTVEALTFHASYSNSSSYMYIFSHRPESPETTLGISPWLKGANHGDEIAFVFGLPESRIEGDSENLTEKRLSEQIMDYWTNFAKYGNPNGSGLPWWPEYSTAKQEYMNFDLELSLRQNPYPEVVDFWLQKIPDILQNKNTTV